MHYQQSLFSICRGLRYFGIGAKVKSTLFPDPKTYFLVTNVELSKDQMHGKVFGRMVRHGNFFMKELQNRKALRKMWYLHELPNYKEFKATREELLAMTPFTEYQENTNPKERHQREREKKKAKKLALKAAASTENVVDSSTSSTTTTTASTEATATV